jgi:hypothetical protein
MLKGKLTRKLAVALLLAAGLVLVGCGSNNSNSTNTSGNWTAALTNSSDGSQACTFTTSITENNDGALSVTNLTLSSSSCFVSGETESGSFALGGNLNGNVTGQFQFKVLSAPPSNNVLTLTGTANGKTIKHMDSNWWNSLPRFGDLHDDEELDPIATGEQSQAGDA